jgi:hypothetical protein
MTRKSNEIFADLFDAAALDTQHPSYRKISYDWPLQQGRRVGRTHGSTTK